MKSSGGISKRLAALLAAERLSVFGGFHPRPEDGAPEGTGTLLLLGPDEPGFWDHVTAQPEFADNAPDPLDRWSARAIGAIARDIGAAAVFPFGGPPYAPFTAWARRSGRAWASPVGLLVHDRAGLLLSYRGALALTGRLVLPPPPPASPCDSCTGRECETACPVNALTSNDYHIQSCHTFLAGIEGELCMSGGCQVRISCPISQGYGRLKAQSAFHMRAFHK